MNTTSNRNFFNTTLGLSMLPDGDVRVTTLTLEAAQQWLQGDFENVANPSHANSLQMLSQRLGMVEILAAKGGRVVLEKGDQVLVAQIGNVPRETREFTAEEISAATFEFRLVEAL